MIVSLQKVLLIPWQTTSSCPRKQKLYLNWAIWMQNIKCGIHTSLVGTMIIAYTPSFLWIFGLWLCNSWTTGIAYARVFPEVNELKTISTLFLFLIKVSHNIGLYKNECNDWNIPEPVWDLTRISLPPIIAGIAASCTLVARVKPNLWVRFET